MYTVTTYPPIFQHSLVPPPMRWPAPAGGYGRYVALVRTLRDGSVTREYLPEHLAELIVAMIPHGEPLVASARIAYSELYFAAPHPKPDFCPHSSLPPISPLFAARGLFV